MGLFLDQLTTEARKAMPVLASARQSRQRARFDNLYKACLHDLFVLLYAELAKHSSLEPGSFEPEYEALHEVEQSLCSIPHLTEKIFDEPEILGQLYERLLDEQLVKKGKAFHLESKSRTRKNHGIYYTPPELIEEILDFAVEPVLAQATNHSNFRICDPACGTGFFLLATARRIKKRLELDGKNYRDIVAKCLYGVDLDPMAATICRMSLALECQGAPEKMHVQDGDSLEMHSFRWVKVFPQVFKNQRKGFDAVIGNPPFKNAIQSRDLEELKARRLKRFPLLTGTADLAFYFLNLATEIVHSEGYIGLIQPRAVLNAKSARAFRANVPNHLKPNFIFCPNKANHFAGAEVFVCLLGLGPKDHTLVKCETSQQIYSGPLKDENWWLGTRVLLGSVEHEQSSNSPLLGEHFQVFASMTTGDAYDCLKDIVDDESETGQKLITTGLIEPNHHCWGKLQARILGKKFLFPRLISCSTPSLERRVQQSRRPKIVVAGLCSKIECYFDPLGESIGMVSTYSIYHPADDCQALESLCKYLLQPEQSRLFHAVLGANAMGGGNITMTKDFLLNLPLTYLHEQQSVLA